MRQRSNKKNKCLFCRLSTKLVISTWRTYIHYFSLSSKHSFSLPLLQSLCSGLPNVTLYCPNSIRHRNEFLSQPGKTLHWFPFTLMINLKSQVCPTVEPEHTLHDRALPFSPDSSHITLPILHPGAHLASSSEMCWGSSFFVHTQAIFSGQSSLYPSKFSVTHSFLSFCLNSVWSFGGFS